MRFPGLLVASLSNVLTWVLVALVAAGALCVAYGIFVERTWFRRRSYTLELLPEGAERVSVLHLSDMHMLRRSHAMARFLSSLSPPDVTIVTGDMLGEPQAVETVVATLRPLRGRLASYFVLGSNDYYAPQPLNYAAYFRSSRRSRTAIRGRAENLVAGLETDGWIHLKNRKAEFSADGVRFEVAGMDDPHIQRQDLRVVPRTDPDAMGLAIVHSPDPAPELAAFGYDLIIAGHTHGGQVRLPFVGALVTNGQMPTRIARGLSRIPPALMHVSPGLGTSKFAPFRFLCRPEATYLELDPRR